MLWVVVDVALAVLVLVLLAVALVRLWRRVRVLMRQVRAAGDAVAPATGALAAAQASGPVRGA